MKKSLAAFAFALAAALAQPASAITFSKLTTIYIGTGVREAATSPNVATAFSCSNVSGVNADVRILVLGFSGTVRASDTRTLGHGTTRTWVTHPQATYSADFNLNTGTVGQGAVNIESTQSAVFCNAVLLDGVDAADGFVLPLVRVNPHPGTVE